jgi:hypothetical protein
MCLEGEGEVVEEGEERGERRLEVDDRGGDRG